MMIMKHHKREWIELNAISKKMKKLEFKTSKGSFILVDVDSDGRVKLPTNIEHQEIGRVKNITEEQFADVVEMQRIFNPTNPYCIDDIVYKNYMGDDWLWSSKESFESLVKSLGWYLWDNPIKKHHYYGEQMIAEWQYDRDWQEAESKTFFNPVLLKKI